MSDETKPGLAKTQGTTDYFEAEARRWHDRVCADVDQSLDALRAAQRTLRGLRLEVGGSLSFGPDDAAPTRELAKRLAVVEGLASSLKKDILAWRKYHYGREW